MSKSAIFFIAALLMTYLGYATEQTLPRRYQEPLSPYPYNQEEVVFHNSNANVTLAGTLTWPDTIGPSPVVMLLHGSAPLDRDCQLFGHKFFLVWADYLTRQGIAVLRFDKRSAGKSTGNYDTSTIEDFAEDALAGINYLKTRKEINPKQIGLIGSSEGGSTALLAASRSPDVSFVVLLAAPAVNMEKILLSQEALLQRADGIPEEFITQSLEFRKQMFTILKGEQDRELAEKQLRGIYKNYFSQLTPSQKLIAETYYGSTEDQIKLFNSRPFRYNMQYDPVMTLKKVKLPILALNGSLDFVVYPGLNLSLIAKTLEEMNHRDYTIIEIPNVNHLFQTCKTGSMREYAEVEETASPLALKKVSDWILNRTTRNN